MTATTHIRPAPFVACAPASSTVMRLDVRPDGDGLAVVIGGDVDSVTAAGLRESLVEVLARPGGTTVLVDLRGVTFLDSAGLCALATAHRDARTGGKRLELRVGDNRAVLRPLQLTGLWDLLAHAPD